MKKRQVCDLCGGRFGLVTIVGGATSSANLGAKTLTSVNSHSAEIKSVARTACYFARCAHSSTDETGGRTLAPEFRALAGQACCYDTVGKC